MKLIDYTIQDYFNRRITETPQALAYYFDDFAFTWEDVGKITYYLVGLLQAKGIRQGNKVGILSTNSNAWIFHFFALQLLGAKTVLLNAAHTDDEIIYSMELTEINYLCYGEGYRRNFDELLERISLTCMRETFHGSFKIIQDNRYWREIAKETPTIDVPKISEHEVCCFLFTSGTTMNSKAVMLSHHNLVNNATAIVEAMRWNSKDKMCVAVPFFHCFGLTACILTGLIAGFPLYILSHYRTVHVCKMIEENQCSILNGVPSMFLAMKHNPNHVHYDLSSVRSGIIAGSPIFENDYYDICQLFREDIHLQPSYGQTESSPCITIADYEDDQKTKATTVGKTIDHVELRIVDDETGIPCSTGVMGMIQTRGYHIMKGYYSMEDATNKVLTEDGWLITGDIGYLDEKNYLHISGRKKNLIIRGGENISPEEIEYYIRQIDGIDIVKVMGIPAVVLQEEIIACITTRRTDLTIEDIIAKLKCHLADYKIPKYIFFMNEIKKSASGKIDEKWLMNAILKKIKEES